MQEKIGLHDVVHHKRGSTCVASAGVTFDITSSLRKLRSCSIALHRNVTKGSKPSTFRLVRSLTNGSSCITSTGACTEKLMVQLAVVLSNPSM